MHQQKRWIISALEAKTGLEPALKKAKALKKISDLDQVEETKKTLDEKRIEYLKSTIFKVERFLLKNVKKAITFGLRGLIKKTHQARAIFEKAKLNKEKCEEAEQKEANTKISKAFRKSQRRLESIQQELEKFKMINVHLAAKNILQNLVNSEDEFKSHPILMDIIGNVSEETQFQAEIIEEDVLKVARLSFSIALDEISDEKDLNLLKQKKIERSRLNGTKSDPKDITVIDDDDDDNNILSENEELNMFLEGVDEDTRSVSSEILDLQKKKKNRAGQSARRKQWEEKYGTNAKHLKKVEMGQKNMQRALFDRGEKKPYRISNTKAESKAVAPKSLDIENIHPSWQAKLRQKEQLRMKAEGKKIIFNTNDEDQ